MSRHPTLFIALLLLLCSATPSGAEEGLRLHVEGKAVTTRRPLHRSPDGTVWIAREDVEAALGAFVRDVIPRPVEAGQRKTKRAKARVILASPTHAGLYRGAIEGAGASADLELKAVAKVLGRRVRQRGGVYDLSAAAASRAPGQRARVGQRVSPFRLSTLGGGTLRFPLPEAESASEATRLLIMTWASWSPTRAEQAAWVEAVDMVREEHMALWLVALDVEGEDRVRSFVTQRRQVDVGIDRQGTLMRVLPLQDAGQWFYIDELGVLRAQGRGFNETDRLWVAAHRNEELVAQASVPAAPQAAVALQVLRERILAEPDAAAARLALDAALPPDAWDERLANTSALVEAHPQSAAFALRLTAQHLDAGDRTRARETLDAARMRISQGSLLHEQYLALAYPQRFYSGAIDLVWLAAKRKELRELLPPRGGKRRRDKPRK